MKRVENKVILVTGGAMGMGRSHSELLAAQGAWVFVADVNAAEGQACSRPQTSPRSRAWTPSRASGCTPATGPKACNTTASAWA